ncbi:large ribosomal subunit protein bL34m [Hetaerina americana]|uniref:large ribosomal subunit protein bL34m n=1 Tax=Hetaerina americana TaxID=62018 RepID=UPI003A7F453B
MAFLLASLLKPKMVCDSLFSRGIHCVMKEQVNKLSCESKALQSFTAPNLFLKVFNVFGITSVRSNVRIHFPRPDERKRIQRHGWRKRMSTIAGRKILMRRILKGRHVLSH